MPQPFPLTMLASLPEPVLSVYLATNPLRHLNRNSDHGYVGWFGSHAKRLLATTDSSEQSSLGAEIKRVEHFLEEKAPDVRGMALFAGPHVWHAISLPSEPENELHWGKPTLWQLGAMAHRHRAWCVGAVDLSGAHLFSFRCGELMPLETLEFHIDPSHWKRMQAFHTAERKAGMPHGPQRDLFERRCDTHYLRFLCETAHRVAHACDINDLKQILLLGPSRYTGIVEHKLPSSLKKQTIQIPYFWHSWDSPIPLKKVLEEALLRYETDCQDRQVGELLNRSRAVVTGAEETLAMLQRGRVGLLFVDETFNPVLRYCRACEHASASSARDCPRCQLSLVDCTLHEILPQMLIRYTCDCEFLSGQAAERLRRVGSVGGRLRLRRPLSDTESSLRREVTLAHAGVT